MFLTINYKSNKVWAKSCTSQLWTKGEQTFAILNFYCNKNAIIAINAINAIIAIMQ